MDIPQRQELRAFTSCDAFSLMFLLAATPTGPFGALAFRVQVTSSLLGALGEACSSTMILAGMSRGHVYGTWQMTACQVSGRSLPILGTNQGPRLVLI